MINLKVKGGCKGRIGFTFEWNGLEVTISTKMQVWSPEEGIMIESNLGNIYIGIRDEASGNNEITQKEMGKESGQQQPAVTEERPEDKSILYHSNLFGACTELQFALYL